MKHNRFKTALFTLLVLFAWTPLVSAHRPATAAAGITEIPNITTSFAYYQELKSADQVDQYTFTADAGDFFHAGINIPAIEGLEAYGVTMALVGPGLPELPAAALPEIEVLETDHHHDGGKAAHEHTRNGLILPSTISEDFYEPFTQTNYWGRQVLELDLPESGTYTLLIWNPAGTTGKYVLDTGTAEVFGPTDLFRFPLWWINVHTYFEHTPYLVAAGLGLVVLAIVGLRWRHGRSAQATGKRQRQESFA